MLQEQQCASLPGLNPCCSERWSRTQLQPCFGNVGAVLILVVVDNGLVLCNEVKYGTSNFAVLIHIIVDNGLVPKIRQNMPELSCCINPYCSGR